MSFNSVKGIQPVDYHKSLVMSDGLRDLVVHYLVTRETSYEGHGWQVTFRTYRTTNIMGVKGLIVKSFMTEEELRTWEREQNITL